MLEKILEAMGVCCGCARGRGSARWELGYLFSNSESEEAAEGRAMGILGSVGDGAVLA